MSASDTRPLFSRDLKHLVDSRRPKPSGRKHRALFRLLLGAGAVAAGIWVISALIIPYITLHVPIESTQETAATDIEQIPPQSAALGKPAVTLNSDPKQTKATADASPATTKSAGAESPAPAQDKTEEANIIAAHPNEDTVSDGAASSDPEGEQPDPNGDAGGTHIVWQDYKVQSGDSLARIFTKHQLSVGDAIRIAKHEQAKAINRLRPGQKMRIGYDDNGNLHALSVELRSDRNLVIAFDQDGSIQVDEIQREFDKREAAVSAVIDSSLFKAGAKAGLNDKFILKLVGIFGWDIDFAMDLKKGDRFTVVYEQLVDGKTEKGTGDILAAEFINQQRKLYAFRHVNEQSDVQYFDAEGNSLRGTFLRTPMKISRITSGFSKKRKHPILNKWRTHNGVDYAAPRGTPILATADGRVSFLGKKEGYGKTIVLRHGSKYNTLYAHLSSYKSKLKPGSTIAQGQVIGFVGMTGMATAPHLHYEFRVHGNHRDPLSYEFPKAESIQKAEREKFITKAQHWMETMAQYNGIQLAQNESKQ